MDIIDVSRIHELSLNKVFSSLKSSQSGLSDTEVKKRFEEYGMNQLTEKKDTPIIVKFLLQFNNFFSYLLLFGAILSFSSEWLMPGEGSIYIAWALLGVTVLNAIFTFIQEYKAEQAMKSFKNLMTSQVIVQRDGKKIQVNSKELVPGDIIYLAEGDKITADARLIEVTDLKVDHSSLTGESEPQLRSLKSTSDNLLMSRNMVFSGTLVQSGIGKAIVITTGDSTQIGQIAKVTKEVETQTSHLQMQIGHFIKIISYIAILLGVSFFAMGWLIMDTPFWTNLVFAIGIIVANVPEGLLPTVTLTLSITAQRMAKRQVLIKNIDALETLGSLTVICSDKTGTLTENNLNVHGFYMNNGFYKYDHGENNIMIGNKVIRERDISGGIDFADIILLCNNSTYDNDKQFGDPTEICLKQYVASFHNISYIEKQHPRTLEIPFSSETKYMVTVNKFDNKYRAHMKGAIKVVLDRCSHIYHNGKKIKLTKNKKLELIDKNREFARQGFRVLGCALKDMNSSSKKNTEQNDYCFYGLIVMQDPPRIEVPEAVNLCHKAGIKVIVISGDQSTTVENISRQVGVIKSNKPTVINAEKLAEYSDEELKEILGRDEVVFSRALPKDKLRIVTLLKEMGEIVAVTGDGVNDAPALRKADVGIAMGKSGTEVAKEAADIVLLDDNFASIINGIKYGRTVYDNIKSFITYILTSNTPEIVPFLFFILLGWPLALPVLLILAIDLGTDMLPAIGLGMEASSEEIMLRKPRDPKSKLLNWKMIARSYGFIGPLQTLFSYIIFFSILITGGWSFGKEIAVNNPVYMSAITGFFVTIVITQMFNVFACRTTRASVFSKGFLSNKWILFGIATEILLISLIALSPYVQKIFGTTSFPLKYVAFMIGFGIILLFAEESRKLVYRRYGIFGIDE